MIHYSSCPVCSGPDLTDLLAVKDHTVSQKFFSIWHCNACTLRFTQDAPSVEEMGPYYQSENYISHTDINRGLINRLYHIVRKLTLSSKRRLIMSRTGLAKGNILDIGCGTGAFLHTMKNTGWKITGLEPDALAMQKAQELYGIMPLPSDDLNKLVPGTYDAITMWHVLEHVHELSSYMKAVYGLLKADGKLFIAVPNYTSYDAGVYRENWAAWDVPRHLYHFSPLSMKQLIRSNGLQLDTVRAMWFDSFYVSLLSEKYINGSGNIFRACWNGLVSNLKAMNDKETCSSVIYIISKAGQVKLPNEVKQ